MSDHEDAITILSGMNRATRRAMMVTLGPGTEATLPVVGGFYTRGVDVRQPAAGRASTEHQRFDHITISDLLFEIQERARGRPTPPRRGRPVTAAFVARLEAAAANPIYDVRAACRSLPGGGPGGGANAPDAHTSMPSAYEPWRSYDLGSLPRTYVDGFRMPRWHGRGEQP